ncbi:M50 family peptidase [Cohnella endophytica]|uniref:M50 family peptidase n=1 Tax=Cohnella endophytica TaxID=2419778 RepID=A0A494X8V0_9BACL|nr:M50 family metallopeptidase [Cohnella endophytica]RKP44806.1 M50 family peptidase [Cohnella endophytica]
MYGQKEEIIIRAWIKTAIYLTVAAFLTRFVPFSEFFRNVDTLVHELSHALVTLILSGSVRVIYLYSDQSGVTYSSYASAWKAIPISLAGYMGSALFSLLLFYLHSRKKEKAGLIAIAIVAALGLALFVRNGYGMAWCGGFAAVTVLVYTLSRPGLIKGYYLLIAFICLVESVISAIILLSIALQRSGTAGDASNLSQATHVPAVFWSLLFVLFSLWCARSSVALFSKRGFD